LQGEIKAIRENYKSNQFRVTFEGDGEKIALGTGADFEILKVESDGMEQQATVRIRGGQGPNALIRHLLDKVEIRAFHEVLPNMNDIFIQAVNQASGRQAVRQSSNNQ